MPLYAADLGVTGLTVEVTEIQDDKSDAVAATTTGITELGTTGVYYRNWTLNSATALLYWQKQSDATVFAIGPATERDVDAILTDTADMQPKLGTPVADLAADIATVDGNVDTILVDTADMQPKLGTPAGASISADIASVQTDTDAIEVDTQDIQSRLPAALVSGKIDADATAISGSTAAADNLQASAETIIVDSVASGFAETTTTLKGGGTATLDATDDHYNGRIIIFTSGVLQNQATDITDYTGSTNVFTVTALTEAPSDADTFVIV